MLIIKQTLLNKQLRSFIFDNFEKYDIKMIGYSGFAKNETAFYAKVQNEIVGLISVHPVWGALWIKALIIKEEYRNQGLATKLMEQALKFAQEKKCKFAFVETFSFQAPKFYQKLGFELEFSRAGYSDGISFHYLRKYL